MNIKRWTIPVALAATLALALAAPALAADPVRPFGGSTIGAGSMGPPNCPGAAWQYMETSTGEMLHLGRVTLVVSHCTFVDTWSNGAPATGHTGPGTFTFTAANGDMLILGYQSLTFQISPDGLFSHADGTWVVAGGTGRFAGATGSGGTVAIFDIATETNVGTFRGTIAY